MKRRKRRQHTPPLWGRVKTACIAALLVCNVLLLAVFGADTAYDAVLARQMRSSMDSLLAQRGVLCGSSVYRTLDTPPQAYTMRMDSGVQSAFANAVLTGTVQSGADKGNATVWTGENGSLHWAASGAVTGSFALRSLPEPRSSDEAQKLIVGLLETSGISVRKNQVTASQYNTEYTVKVTQYVGRTELLGCSLTFSISEGNETTLDGKWCTGGAEPLSVRALESYSAQQAVFRLIEAQPSVAQIISAQPVYVLSDRSGGRFTAIPCWRFSADAGDFVMNILTGDVVASADIDTEPDVEPDAAGSAVWE